MPEETQRTLIQDFCIVKKNSDLTLKRQSAMRRKRNLSSENESDPVTLTQSPVSHMDESIPETPLNKSLKSDHVVTATTSPTPPASAHPRPTILADATAASMISSRVSELVALTLARSLLKRVEQVNAVSNTDSVPPSSTAVLGPTFLPVSPAPAPTPGSPVTTTHQNWLRLPVSLWTSDEVKQWYEHRLKFPTPVRELFLKNITSGADLLQLACPQQRPQTIPTALTSNNNNTTPRLFKSSSFFKSRSKTRLQEKTVLESTSTTCSPTSVTSLEAHLQQHETVGGRATKFAPSSSSCVKFQDVGIFTSLQRLRVQEEVAYLQKVPAMQASEATHPLVHNPMLQEDWVTREWLPNYVGLAQYAPLFSAHHINALTLLALTRSHLERQLDIRDEQHLEAILSGIAVLRSVDLDLTKFFGNQQYNVQYLKSVQLATLLQNSGIVKLSNGWHKYMGISGAYLASLSAPGSEERVVQLYHQRMATCDIATLQLPLLRLVLLNLINAASKQNKCLRTQKTSSCSAFEKLRRRVTIASSPLGGKLLQQHHRR